MIDLKLKRILYFEVPVTFKLARYTARSSNHLVTILEINGITGFGCSPTYSGTGKQIYRGVTSKLISQLGRNKTFSSYEIARHEINEISSDIESGLAHSIDLAIWDAEAKTLNKPLNAIFDLNTPIKRTISLTEQIFISKLSKVQTQLNGILSRGTSRLKLKVGRNILQDLEFIRDLRSQLGNSVRFQVDANSSLNLRDAISIAPKLREYGVDMWEDPLSSIKLDDYGRLRKATGLKVMLDASIKSLPQLKQAIEENALDILNIKLSRIGGITCALRFVKICRDANVGLSIGCAEDLGASMVSIFHLASSIEDLYGVEGLGHTRLGFDIVQEGPCVQNGRVGISSTSGTGVNFDEKALITAARKFGFTVYDFMKGCALTPQVLEFNRLRRRALNIPEGMLRRLMPGVS